MNQRAFASLLREAPVYVILDPAQLLPGARLLEVAGQVLASGVRIVQLRDKINPTREVLASARAITQLCDRARALCILNDRIDLALAAGAHGVHLGPHDLPVEDARRVAPGLLLGASAGDARTACALLAAGADYLGVGAIFEARPSKADASAPRGLQVIREVRAAIGPEVPFVGIGGITLERTPQVLAAGADGVAMIRAIIQSDDPAREASRSLAAARS